MRAWLAIVVAAVAVAAGGDTELRLGAIELSAADLVGEPVWNADICTLVLPDVKIKGVVRPIWGGLDHPRPLFCPSRRLGFSLDGTTGSMTVDVPSCATVSTVVVYCRSCALGLSVVTDAAVGAVGVRGAPAGGGAVTLLLDGAELPVPPRQQAPHSAAARRRLLATCAPVLTLGAASLPFDHCVPLTPSLNLYYTLTSSGSGSTLTGGIRAAAGVAAAYNAFAWSPDASGGMVGANAVIVYPDAGAASGATVTGIAMTSTRAAALNAAKGSFDIGAAAAAAKNADGSLAATFAFGLPKAPAAYARPAAFVYLFLTGGPLVGTTLGDHERAPQANYGANVMALEASGASSPSPSPSPSPVPVPSPARSPSPSPSPLPSPSPSPKPPALRCTWKGAYYLQSAACPGKFLAVSADGCASRAVGLGARGGRARWALAASSVGSIGAPAAVRSLARPPSCSPRFLAAVGGRAALGPGTAKWAVAPAAAASCAAGVTLKSASRAAAPYLAVTPDCRGLAWVAAPGNAAKWRPAKAA